MILKTSDLNSIKPILKNIHLPKPNSHKGQNGRVLVIGGSSLFHAASIWAAEISSHFVDMVHYSSTKENNEIFLTLKKKFRDGIVVAQEDLLSYVEEDDVILLGPGMIRGKNPKSQFPNPKFSELLKIKDEAAYTYYLTKYLLENFPHKRFVLDAGALQMMEAEWLLKLKTKAIVTPHQGEFAQLFGESVNQYSADEKASAVQKYARKYNCIILLKAISDFISEGTKTVIVEGGNAGLTKGGTGDILAGLVASLFAKNQGLDSCILSSFILKKTADELFLKKGYWYNIEDIIGNIAVVITDLFSQK